MEEAMKKERANWFSIDDMVFVVNTAIEELEKMKMNLLVKQGARDGGMYEGLPPVKNRKWNIQEIECLAWEQQLKAIQPLETV